VQGTQTALSKVETWPRFALSAGVYSCYRHGLS